MARDNERIIGLLADEISSLRTLLSELCRAEAPVNSLRSVVESMACVDNSLEFLSSEHSGLSLPFERCRPIGAYAAETLRVQPDLATREQVEELRKLIEQMEANRVDC